MTLHIDIPTRAQVDQLLTSRNPSSVSVYLPTDPASAGQPERIELKNLATEAERQLRDLKAADSDIAAIAAAFAMSDPPSDIVCCDRDRDRLVRVKGLVGVTRVTGLPWTP